MTLRRLLIAGLAGAATVACAVLAAVVVGGSSPWLTAAAVAVSVTLGVLVFALRELRRRLAVTDRRLRMLETGSARTTVALADGTAAPSSDEIAALEERLAVAIALLDARGGGAGAEGRALDPDAARRAVVALIARGDLLSADAVVTRYELLRTLRLSSIRGLARGLRARGYLTSAMVYFREAAAAGDHRDVTQLKLREAEVAVASGAFTPTVPAMNPGPLVPGRILHVVGRALPDTQSGYTLRTHSTARAQAAAGQEPHVYVQLGIQERTIAARDEIDGVVYHRPVGESVFTSGHEVWLQRNAEQLLATVATVRPTVLHAHSDYHNAVLASVVGRATGIPVVYETRGFWEETWLSRAADKHGWADIERVFSTFGAPEAYTWRRQRELEARARADATVTLARTMRDRLVGPGADANDFTIVPNAVDAARFRSDAPVEELRAHLGIPAGAAVVGSVTSVVEYEGLDLLVSAFDALDGRTEVDPWLLVVGDGPVLPALRTQAADLGLTNVTFTGRVPHEKVAAFYGLIDVVVVPRRDAEVCRLVTPLKPFEGLAAGAALVMSDVAALAEIAQDCGAARLFRAGDALDLATVLVDLVNHPEEARDLGERGRAWVGEHRSWDANVRTYDGVYAGLTARGRTAAPVGVGSRRG